MNYRPLGAVGILPRPLYWSVVNSIANEMYADEVNERAIEDVWLCVGGWLHDRNRAAIKARGF
jgi:hypothetical protein